MTPAGPLDELIGSLPANSIVYTHMYANCVLCKQLVHGMFRCIGG